MKTKHILTALALPAMFAACTAEDIVNEGANTLQERPAVENLAVKVVEGVESRYAVDGTSSLKFNFETGDKFGAAIIDQYDPSYPNNPEKWDVIESLAGNTPFTYNATTGEWKAPADLPLGVGHYLFVYPYNRADVNRAAVSYELPAVQKLYTEEDGEIDLNAAIEAGNKSFYSTVLTEADEALEITLKNLYAYPKFVINFDNGEKVTTVSKVVLAKKNGFEVKGGFNHKIVANLFANNGDKKFWTSTTNNTTNWDEVQTADLLTTDESYATIETSQYLVAELPLDAEVEEVTNNKTISVRFMMPGFLMDENLSELKNYTMYVYTNNGTYSFTLDGAIEWKKTTKTEAKQKAFARGTANTITIDKDFVKKDNDAPYIVTSVADWNNLVEEYGDKDMTISVAVVGGSLVLDETAEMPDESVFEVNSVTVKGEVELCNVGAGTVTVAEGAVLKTCGTFAAKKIENKGTVNVEAVYNARGKLTSYTGVEAVENYGELNVAEKAIAAFALENYKGAVVENEGTLTVGGNNEGTINNAGTINLDDFKNVEPTWKNGKITNMPTINNKGKILTKGDVENHGTVVNEGTLSCKNQAGTFTNNLKLDAKEDGLTYITENKGDVIVYAPFQEDLVIEGQNGTVTYTTSKANEAFYTETKGDSYVTNVNVSDDYTITAGTVNTLNVLDDATIARTYNSTKDKYVANVDVLNVLEGTTTLGSDFSLTKIYVADGAMVKVPAEKSLEISSSIFENNGEIEVAGTFAALNVSSENAGLVTESGANAKIYWKENADQWSDAATKIEMLAKAVAEYMNEDKNDGEYASEHGYELTLDNFNTHLENVLKYKDKYNTKEEYPEAYAFIEKYDETSVSESELSQAAAKIASVNKNTLMEALKKIEIGLQDATLYEATTGKTAKASAYEAFREAVKANKVKTGLNNSVNYAATALTESEIDAILTEAAPYAYIWEGCDIDELVAVWKNYAGLTKSDYDFKNAVSSEKVGTDYLRKFMLAVKNGDSATAKEIQGLISDWTILELNNMGWSDDQIKACAEVNETETTAEVEQSL